MGRKKIKHTETRLWVEEPPAPIVPWEGPTVIRREQIAGTEVEIVRVAGVDYVRPPSVTGVRADGVPYTERVVAACWYTGFYLPHMRQQRGLVATDMPVFAHHDGLLSDDLESEEANGRFSAAAGIEESADDD